MSSSYLGTILVVFGVILGTTGFILGAIGNHFRSRGSLVRQLGSILTCLGSYLASFWGHLASLVMSRVSFWVPQASKMHPSDVQASVMKTYQNNWFLLILEWWEALVATRNGIWKLTGWLGWLSRLAGQAGEDSGIPRGSQGPPWS